MYRFSRQPETSRLPTSGAPASCDQSTIMNNWLTRHVHNTQPLPIFNGSFWLTLAGQST